MSTSDLRTDLRTYQVSKIHDGCGGEMKCTGGMDITMDNKPAYEHKCAICGEHEIFERVYPKLMYEKKE